MSLQHQWSWLLHRKWAKGQSFSNNSGDIHNHTSKAYSVEIQVLCFNKKKKESLFRQS
jgi:hypothetical protein